MDIQLLLDTVIASFEGDCSAQVADCVPLLTAMRDECPKLEEAYSRYVRETAKSKVPEAAKADLGRAKSLLDSVEALLRLDCRTDFDSYVQMMEWRRDPSKRFYQPRREVLYTVVQDLQDLFDDRIDFYALSLPPRVGKSTIGCFFVSFVMGNYPEDANLMSGFSDKLTSSFHTEVMSLVCDSDTYCFAEIFPDAPYVDSNRANETVSLLRASRFPTLTCRSVGGTLTGAVEVGKRGYLYCDDMVEDYEQALNPERMDKLYEAYLNQLKDRKLDGAKEIHIGTRWVPNDVIGRQEADHAGDPRYRFRRIPALDENGESNFVYANGMGFSTAYYEDMREALVSAGSEDSWSAKYMCEPYWKEGRLFTEAELSWYEELPDGDPDAVLAVCDTKTKGPDYCAMAVVKVYGEQHYVCDVVCDDGLMEGITPRIVDKLVDNGVQVARFESNVAGGSIARDVERMCRDRGYYIDMKTKYSTENKETRILADSGWIKKRCLFRCDSGRGQEYGLFMSQLMSYSAKSKNKHDDVPDCMSMYRRFAQAQTSCRAEAMARPW